jgi:hypothetical protein
MKVKNHFKYIYKKQDMSINKINFKIANLQKNNKATGAK